MTTPTPGGNGYDPEKVRAVIERIQNLEGRKLSIKMTAMRECKVVAEDLKQLLKDAKAELGIPPKVLREKVKELQLLAKADEIRASLDTDDQDEFDLVTQALGDFAWTPLGEAALAAVQNVEVKMRAAADGVDNALGKGGAKKRRTTTEERLAKRAAAVGGKQADLEEAAKAATEKDEASGGEVVEFVSKTHAERAATNGAH